MITRKLFLKYFLKTLVWIPFVAITAFCILMCMSNGGSWNFLQRMLFVIIALSIAFLSITMPVLILEGKAAWLKFIESFGEKDPN